MSPVNFRKTLLALAITATALPVYAAPMELTDKGLIISGATPGTESTVEITGSFNGDTPEAIRVESAFLEKDLVLNANISADGNTTSGVTLLSYTQIKGDVINKGSVTVTNKDGAALSLFEPIIDGSVINEGVLTAEGENATALKTEKSTIAKDLKNAKGGKISAEGLSATGISITETTLSGELVNDGSIMALGESSKGISMSGSSNIVEKGLTNNGQIIVSGAKAAGISISGDSLLRGNLVNKGELTVTGENATGISLSGTNAMPNDLINSGDIKVKGDASVKGISVLTQLQGTLLNTGTILVESAKAIGIEIGGEQAGGRLVSVENIENKGSIIAKGDGSIGLSIAKAQALGNALSIDNSGTIAADGTAILIGEGIDQNLTIINSGALSGGTFAIDASGADAASPVNLTLNQGSKVIGDLKGLSAINVLGNVSLNGDIMMKGTYDVVKVGKDANQTGHLELGKTHSQINGDLTVARDSSLGLNLSTDTNPGKAILNIKGVATFEANSQIKLGASGKDFSADGSTYTLVEAGLITDQGLKVNSSSALLNIDTYKTADNKVVATVTGKGKDEIDEIIDNQIGGGSNLATNSKNALGSFNSDGLMARLDANDPIFKAFANADEKQLAELAKQLTPEINGGAAQAALTSQAMINNATSGRTSAVRGQSSGEGFKDTGLWMQSLYSDATQGMRDGISGYNAHSRGMAIGADGKLNEDVTLGLAYSFVNTDVNGKSGNNTKVDSHAFTLYGGLEHGNYFADASLTYGKNSNEGERHIAGTKAKADYDSSVLGLNLEGGYTYALTEQVLVEPRLAARYSLVDIDGYREKGSSASLKVDDQRFEAIELGAGLRVAGSFPLGKGTLMPQAKLMAYHDLAADQTSSTSTFVLGSTPFVTTGAKAVRNSYEAGVGADYQLGDVTLGLNYDYVGKSGFDADTFTAKVRYNF